MDQLRIGYVNIFVSNFERSLQFYRDSLGLTIEKEDAGFGYASFKTEFNTGATAFAFAQTDSEGLVGRHTGIGWVVADVDQAFEALSKAGVVFESPPAQQPWGGYMAIFKDPDDNLFYLDQSQAG